MAERKRIRCYKVKKGVSRVETLSGKRGGHLRHKAGLDQEKGKSYNHSEVILKAST